MDDLVLLVSVCEKSEKCEINPAPLPLISHFSLISQPQPGKRRPLGPVTHPMTSSGAGGWSPALAAKVRQPWRVALRLGDLIPSLPHWPGPEWLVHVSLPAFAAINRESIKEL